MREKFLQCTNCGKLKRRIDGKTDLTGVACPFCKSGRLNRYITMVKCPICGVERICRSYKDGEVAREYCFRCKVE